jgi:enterochelin esterase-like enzyme/outer membrane protein assembly factor BamB
MKLSLSRWKVLALTLLLLPLLAVAMDAPATGWTSMRGPNADGSVRDVRLFEGETAGLKVAWKRALGSGYAVTVVADGRVVTLFAEGEDDLAAAFDAQSGDELWRYRIDATYKGHDGSHDGPIATPALAGGKVFGLSPRGKLFALDAATGAEAWATQLVEEHGGTKPWYGFSSSPVVAEGVLVVGLGGGEGKAIAGFDGATGALLWTVGDKDINYQSPVVATLGGRQQVLAADQEMLYGIDAKTGATLWSYAHQGDERAMGGGTLIPMPAGDDRLFMLHQNDTSAMLQVTAKDDGYEVAELWTTEGIRRSYVQPVIHKGSIYGMNNRIFTCIDAATGETRWRSREPGDGFPTLVGDHLVIITKPGTLHIAEASPEAYREVARLELFKDHSWSTVSYAEGSLYARSMGELARIDLVGSAVEPAVEEAPAWLAATEFGQFLQKLAGLETDAAKTAAVDQFLAEQSGFPVVEASGVVHFLYRGEAQDVAIVGDLIGFRREDPMVRVPGTDLFYYSTRLEPDASATYGFLPDYEGEVLADPRNPRVGRGLFGEVSWFAMPGRRLPVLDGEAARKGRLETVEWESAVREGAKRGAQVYLPAGYDETSDTRYPVIYIHDGPSALDSARLPEVFDHLMGTTAAPAIAVFILPDEENPRADRQDVEGYFKLVANELVPAIDARFRTLAHRADRATFGAADGGNAALSLALLHPETFGKAASQSAMVMDADREFGEMAQGADQWSTQIYQGWGTYHMRSPHEAWSMVEGNRRLWQLLRERGFRPTGGERPEGFGWACWQGHVGAWLSTLFPLT